MFTMTSLSSVAVAAVFGVCAVLSMCDVHYRKDGRKNDLSTHVNKFKFTNCECQF